MLDDFIKKLALDFPEFNFRHGKKYAFRPPKTILTGPEEPESKLLALHELSHALLEHSDFKLDARRLKMENAAWEKARELAKRYQVDIDENFIQSQLDTYRDWLHQKSRCPKCGLTRFQGADEVYHCPRCENFN